MVYQFPPNLERLVHERMTAGGYRNEDELIMDAMLALEDVERRREESRGELSRRINQAGTTCSQPLDRSAFKAEARQRQNRTP